MGAMGGAMLGGGILNLIGGHQQGQAQDRASRHQQGFLEDAYNARGNSPYMSRINQILGLGGGMGGGQQMPAGLGDPAAPTGHPLSIPPSAAGGYASSEPVWNEREGAYADYGPQPGGQPQPSAGLSMPGTAPHAPQPGAGGPQGQSLVDAIMGVQRRGAVQSARQGSQTLQNALGRAGATGGIAAGAEAAQGAMLPGQLANIEAGGMQMERDFGRQDINDLLNIMNVAYPSPGSTVGALAGSYGQPGAGGQGLMGMGNALGSLGMMGAMGMFGDQNAGGFGPFGGGAPMLPTGYGDFGPEQY